MRLETCFYSRTRKTLLSRCKLISKNLPPMVPLLVTILGTSTCAGRSLAPSPEARDEIVAMHSNKCLDVEGSSKDDGARVLQWECLGQPNQLWKIIPGSRNTSRIVAQHSEKCLSIGDAEKIGEDSVVQQKCLFDGDHPDQEWEVRNLPGRSEANPGNIYQIISSQSGKCLDVDGSNMENGASIIQYDCSGSTPNQLWLLNVPLGQPLPARPPEVSPEGPPRRVIPSLGIGDGRG